MDLLYLLIALAAIGAVWYLLITHVEMNAFMKSVLTLVGVFAVIILLVRWLAKSGLMQGF